MEKRACSSNSDRISDLSTEILENVLSCLPLRDAIKTSILSKKWRYKWLYLSQLVFDGTFCRVIPGRSVARSREHLMLAIFQTLVVHRGNLLKFTFSIPGLGSCPELDSLILFLSGKNVREVKFHLFDRSLYKLPSSLFSCIHLSSLELRCCIFNPPPTFTGFDKLVCIKFHEVNFTAIHVVESFFSKCPLLERLTLEDCSYVEQLEIDAPNLKFLTFVGDLVSICFKNTPLLATVTVSDNKDCPDPDNLYTGETSTLIKSFICLPAIEHLFIGWNFLLYLSVGNIPERLPTTFEFLEVLEVDDIWFGSPSEASAALCLIRSSPNLRKLKIRLSMWEEPPEESIHLVLDLLGDQYPSQDCLHQLREAHLTDFCGKTYELDIVRFFLVRSLRLEKMVIQPPKGTVDAENLQILRKVIRFKRVSPDAEIIYLDPDKKHV